MNITKKQAKKFMLMKHGLYGKHTYSGKDGIFEYITNVYSIQFDPLDICGKNHELVLQSRIKGFKKSQIYDLLYKDRVLMDWWDKCQCIMPTTDWKYFSHHRENAQNNMRSSQHVDEVKHIIMDHINENGPICSSDIKFDKKVDWGWNPTSLSRAALETLYSRGELVIEHKKNTRKFYDITEKYIDDEILVQENPNEDEYSRVKWNIYRRIGSVGLLHNRTSDAFVGIYNYNHKYRPKVFADLLKDDLIGEIYVDGIDLPYYYHTSDTALLEQAMNTSDTSNRLEFIAPLDNLIWDRRVIDEIFGFKYKWEVYTPVAQRKFGHYVLPILYKDNFIGRIELKRNKKTKQMEMQNLWWEHKKYDKPRANAKILKNVERFSKIMY